MSGKKAKKNKKAKIGIEQIAVCALLAAVSIVTGKVYAINVTNSIRLSFENFPILLAGFYFGPLAGIAVGTVADVVGCLLVGYAINPVITLGAALIGLCAGIAGLLPIRNRRVKVITAVVFPHLIGSLIVKTVGLALYYPQPFLPLLGWRALTYTLICAAEATLLYILTGHRAFDRELRRANGAKK